MQTIHWSERVLSCGHVYSSAKCACTLMKEVACKPVVTVHKSVGRNSKKNKKQSCTMTTYTDTHTHTHTQGSWATCAASHVAMLINSWSYWDWGNIVQFTKWNREVLSLVVPCNRKNIRSQPCFEIICVLNWQHSCLFLSTLALCKKLGYFSTQLHLHFIENYMLNFC